MKKRLIIALTSLSMLLTFNVALAHQDKHENEVKATLFQFVALGLGGLAVHKASTAVGCDSATKAVLQLSNVMVQGGTIFAKPALTDLGFRALLASGAASAANNPFVKGNMEQIPFVGQHLKAAGSKGVAITTVAFYEMLKMGYVRVVDSMPPSIQRKVRGM